MGEQRPSKPPQDQLPSTSFVVVVRFDPEQIVRGTLKEQAERRQVVPTRMVRRSPLDFAL